MRRAGYGIICVREVDAHDAITTWLVGTPDGTKDRKAGQQCMPRDGKTRVSQPEHHQAAS